MRIRLLIFAISLVLMLTASAQNASPNSVQPQPLDPKLFAAIIVIMIVVVLLPYTYNMYQSHKNHTQVKKDLGEFIDKHEDKIDGEKLVQIVQITNEYIIHAKPIDARRIAYDAMALTITLAVGISLFLFLSHPAIEPANLSIKEVLLAFAVGISLFLLLSHLAIEQHFH
jgi:hypothetical protein